MEKEFYKGGRPRLPREEKSDIFVKVRFKKAEYDRLVERKNKTRSIDLSKFIRAICLEKPLIMKPQMNAYQASSLSLIREMRGDILRIGIQVNHLIRQMGVRSDQQKLQSILSEAAENIKRIEGQLAQISAAIDAGRKGLTEGTENDCENQ
jgi:hypothetical protein